MDMSIVAAFRFPFRGQHRWANLGLGIVCLLIPFVGPIVLLGYGVLVEKALIENPEADAPKFDFGAFVEHLKRGVPGFVISLILVPVAWIAMVIPFLLGLVGFVFVERYPIVTGLFVAAAAILFLIVMALFIVLAIPLTLKAGLEQTIGGAFNWRFISGFLRRVGWLALGYQLLFVLCSMLILPFSLCFLIFAPYIFGIVMNFASWHLRIQLYRAYLERGGEPLHVSITLAPPAFPVNPPGSWPPPPNPY